MAALLWMVTATAFSFVFARLRLETGSVWPAITLHSGWNAITQQLRTNAVTRRIKRGLGYGVPS